jgi:hypothetical protein
MNPKWYLKREGLLDMSASPALDCHLVLTGPESAAASSRGSTLPWSVDAVCLIDAHQLDDHQTARGENWCCPSVLSAQCYAAEIYPRENFRFPLTAAQAQMLALLPA